MKFGQIKLKMLESLTESFSNKKTNDIKTIIKDVKSNNNFKDLYLLYEDIEKKYFDDSDTAKIYVDELSSKLKMICNGDLEFRNYLNNLNNQFNDININENYVYNLLDTLCENDTLFNIEKKVITKKELIKFLTKPKEVNEPINETFTTNENLLHAVLTNNFNILYSNTLNEEQKKELIEILSLSNDDLKNKVSELKEEISGKIETLMTESKTNNELIDKLTKVKDEITDMTFSKYNYFRLTQLKNGL